LLISSAHLISDWWLENFTFFRICLFVWAIRFRFLQLLFFVLGFKSSSELLFLCIRAITKINLIIYFIGSRLNKSSIFLNKQSIFSNLHRFYLIGRVHLYSLHWKMRLDGFIDCYLMFLHECLTKCSTFRLGVNLFAYI